jgi:nicotinamidase-related amidase
MPEKKQKGRQALLVVDVQQGLFERTIPIYQVEQVLANILWLGMREVERIRRQKEMNTDDGMVGEII